MKKEVITFCLIFICSIVYSQTAINTSFESGDGYTAGMTIAGTNKWTGSGSITNLTEYIKTGEQALQLSSKASSQQTDHIAFAKDATGLGNEVYLDMWVKAIALNGEFTIATYDLTPNSSSKRALEIKLTSSLKVKVLSGSSGTEDGNYSLGEWFRLSAKIDYSAGTYKIAVNGTPIEKTYNFREEYTPASLGRPGGEKEYHSIRFSNGNATNDIAIDDLYIGNEPIAGVHFGASDNFRTITLNQPSTGRISLYPEKEAYELNEMVSASISVPEHYLFAGWTGDLSGMNNPQSFTVTRNLTIGANVGIDPANPPASYTITLNQPTGGTIVLEPQQQTYYEGTKIKATLSLNIGYSFQNWTGSLIGSDNPVSFTVNENMNIGAVVVEKTGQGNRKDVSTVSALKTALSQMVPGDEIVVSDGDYNLGGVSLKSLGGTNSNPVVVRAQNIGKVRFTGKTSFTLQACENIIFQGFHFDIDHVSSIFKLEGSSYIRITQNEFRMASTETQSSKWIIFGEVWENATCRSKYNRLDHNLFDGKADGGAWVVIDGSHGTIPDISKYDQIDFNHFRNNKPRVTNEKETIRVGVSDLSMKSSYTTVEHNLFEECDGDPEIVSVKSCDNIIRGNTFLRSLGTLSLRHGFRNHVEGNYFFGEGKTDESGNGCGGLRVYGLDHIIVNNYFEGLTGFKWDAAITITNGDVTNTSSSLTSHFLPENVVFAFNTLVNNTSDIEIGFDNNGNYGRAPKNCLIANNIIINDRTPIIKSYSSASLNGVKFENNIMYPTGASSIGISHSESQIRIIDPKLAKTSHRTPENTDYSVPFEICKLTTESPAINASLGTYSYLSLDSEGQPRREVPDVGADEYNASDPVLYGGLNALHTGIYGSVENYETMKSSVQRNTADRNGAISMSLEGSTLTICAEKEVLEVEIFSITGRPVAKSIETTIELGSLNAGIFLLKIIYSDGSTANAKFLKTKS